MVTTPLLDRAKAQFSEHFEDTGVGKIAFAFAPGRVNLIGEHTDYNNGAVLPMALSEKGTLVMGKRVENTHGFWASTDSESIKTTYHFPDFQEFPSIGWGRYFHGTCKVFEEVTGKEGSCVVSIATNLPLGGGLSSSASLTVAVFSLLEQLYDTKVDPIEKVKACKKAENVYCNVPCGIMDQFVCTLGEEGRALYINCANNEFETVPFSDEALCIVVTDTKVKHDLAAGEYANRKETCEAVACALGVATLANVSMNQLEEFFATSKPDLPAKAFERARHVVGEIGRTNKAVELLKEGKIEEFGKLMNDSHTSLDEDYEVSCKELNEVVGAAQGVEGVMGSRMTGGGFGGCAITLVSKEAVEDLVKILAEKCPYSESFSTTAGPGAISWNED